LCLDENVFQGLFAMLWIRLGFIRLIRGGMHDWGLMESLKRYICFAKKIRMFWSKDIYVLWKRYVCFSPNI